MNSVILASILYGFSFMDCAHIVTIEKDFNKVLQDKDLEKSVDEVVKKLRSFQLPVHPRVAAIYQILQKGMKLYAEQHADSLYMPNKYVVWADLENDVTTTVAPVEETTTAVFLPPTKDNQQNSVDGRRILHNKHPIYDEIMDK